MNPGEKFEQKCYNYLKQTYNDVLFDLKGGMDSTKSDISVIKNNCEVFYIEVKDTIAQSGQFVVHSDDKTETFVFSPKNHSKPNEMTEIIIQYMNNDFHKFSNAGTKGEKLNINSTVFSEWIINHYINKNVKYIISYKNCFVIIPIKKFFSYFEINATYRIKKSGSGKPAKRDLNELKYKIKEMYKTAIFEIKSSETIVKINERVNENKLKVGKYTYYLSEIENNTYRLRRLSDTYNKNVIFKIKLIKNQEKQDLLEFEKDIRN